MSLHKVPYTKILEINPHPNANKLELATCYGFQVVVPKNKYKKNDEVVFIPIDSVISEDLEKKLFPEGSKIKLDKRRIKQIRIRSFPSQGMIIHPDDLRDKVLFNLISLEDDLAQTLEITKYEPPFADHAPRPAQKRNKPLENPRFHKFNGVENIRWFPNLFKEGDEVIVQEKLHGSCVRASIQPAVANTWFKKLKKFFGLLLKYDYCHGSNEVQLQERPGHTGYYGSDVYGAVLEKVNAFKKMQPGETIYGELIGPGIQKDYTYGHTEHAFVLYDVKETLEDGSQEFIGPVRTAEYAKTRGFNFVPVLYQGPFDKEKILKLAEGPSVYCPEEPIREGVVIKAVENYGQNGSKKALKVISTAYLDKNNTDFH